VRRTAVALGILGLLLSPSATLAATGIAFTGLGCHFDYVDPEGIDATIGFGGVVDLGKIAPGVGLEGNVDYWSNTHDVVFASLTRRLISFGGTAKYYLKSQDSPLRPYAGGGIALHLFRSTLKYPAGALTDGLRYDIVQSSSKFGIDFCGGTLYGLNAQLDLMGELRYRLVSDVNQVVLRAGVIYRMAK
jgi:opacity protein-like surface antigen